MKCTKIILSGLVALSATANAMPTQEQTKEAEPLVMDLMRENEAALNSGKKTRVEVAKSAMELAGKADSEAAKLLLMKGAFNLYVRAGEFDKAIETLHSLKAAIPDIPPQNIANIIEASLSGVSPENGGELRKLLDEKRAEVVASSIQTEKFPLAQGIDLEMIKCPAGEFMMGYESWNTWGSALNREQRKLHRVKLTKDFMLGKFPVTCSQWYAIMEDGKKVPEGLEDTPVGNITVPEMQAFCDKLTEKFKAQLDGKVFRLPTDAEWEYASKGGKNLDGMLGKTTGRNGNTGSSSRDSKDVEAIFMQMGYTGDDHARVSDTNEPYFMWKTLPVGKHKPNEWGFMDLIGNAWEVTADKMMDFKEAAEFHKNLRRWNGRQIYPDFEIDPQLKGERHLIRTGFWDKGAATSLGNKNSIGDNDRFPAVGFRVCIGEPLGDWNNATTTTPKLVKDAFALNAAPGSVTELDLGNVPPLQFVYCPAGKFSMGYKEQPALSKVKDVEITSPFWVSKTVIRADQLELLGLNSITNAETGDAVINDGSIVLEKLPSALKERFGKMLPPGYVFRLPTEAEFEYLQKAEMNDKNAQTNIWGVERLYSGGLVALLDKAPAYGRVDVVRRRNHRGVIMTDLVKVNYENQPDKDPVGWTDDPTWSVFRRGLARNCGGGKLVTAPGGGKYHYSFYFAVAPDVDKLNKFYWK